MGASSLTVIQSKAAIYKDVLDTSRELLWLSIGGVVLDGCRIEDHYISEIASFQ